jgi:hypothetical protein
LKITHHPVRAGAIDLNYSPWVEYCSILHALSNFSLLLL